MSSSIFLLFLAVTVFSSSRDIVAFPQNSGSFEVDGFVFDGPADRPSSMPLGSSTTTATTPTDRTPTPTPTPTPPSTSDVSSQSRLDACIAVCPVTPEYNPVCGSDSVDYTNPGSLNCAATCGKAVTIRHYGRCTSSSLVRG